MCDVLVVFGQGKGRDFDAQNVCVSPDDTLRAELASFLIDYIFSEPEDEDTGTQMEFLNVVHKTIIVWHTTVRSSGQTQYAIQ